MREVSCRALAPILAHLDARGIPRAELVKGTRASLALLERSSQRIDWEVFGELCLRLEALVGQAELAEIGASSPKIPALKALAALIGARSHPAAVYGVMFSVVGPSLFHNILTELEDLGGGRLRATISIPPEYRDVPAMFHMFVGGLRVNPTLCGYPAADVTMVLEPRKAVYDVRFVGGGSGLLQRMWRILRGVLRLPTGILEMDAQRVALGASYQDLRDSEHLIRRQQALLLRSKRRRRKAEVARSRAEEQLHRAQKAEGIGLLAGGIAHDFNNLLAEILGNVELAQLDAESGTVPAVPLTVRLERIRQAAERATELTSQLQAYAGRAPSSVREIDVNALVGDARPLLRAATARNIVMHEDFAPNLPGVSGDPIQLQQVLLNLLTNAGAAVESNGGDVTLRTGLAEVDAERVRRGHGAEARPGKHVFIEVRDSGVGMDDATLARIFDPFFSTHAQRRGLGLAAVLGIVRGHRGLIEVVSAPGVGSTFRVLLPSGQLAPINAPAASLSPLAQAGRTVLVADDEPEVLKCMVELLEARGYTVIAAADGEAALDAARRQGTRIDAFVLDRTMPGMSGEAVFRALRAILPDARVILCSGYHDQAGLPALYAEGLAAALSKPFGSAELEEAMARALRSGERR